MAKARNIFADNYNVSDKSENKIQIPPMFHDSSDTALNNCLNIYSYMLGGTSIEVTKIKIEQALILIERGMLS